MELSTFPRDTALPAESGLQVSCAALAPSTCRIDPSLRSEDRLSLSGGQLRVCGQRWRRFSFRVEISIFLENLI